MLTDKDQLSILMNSLIKHEGERKYVYDDATGLQIVPGSYVKGNPTIGVGRLLTKQKGLSDAEIMYLLTNDIKGAVETASNEAWWPYFKYNDARARAIVELIYNMGINRLSGFRKLFANAEVSDWKGVADELRDSLYARQVGTQRLNDLCHQLETGTDP